jgi:3-methylfumaryl-CoA hydratase
MLDQGWTGLQEWVGRERREVDTIVPFPARAMAALLDRDPGPFTRGAALPPAWHWLYFRPVVRQSEVGEDGHPRRGGFMPPVPLPRRMWAGGRIVFGSPLRVGDEASRVSAVQAIREKQGRSGPLIFVSVHHRLDGPAGLVCEEEQDIVYRDAPSAEPGKRPANRSGVDVLDESLDWEETFLPTAALLFRFSALTYNGHRIHYDERYARTEGYPGLVVHAPLLALLLLDAATRRNPERAVSAFEYRAVSALFCDDELRLAGKHGEHAGQLWATDASGNIAMKAAAEFRDGA